MKKFLIQVSLVYLILLHVSYDASSNEDNSKKHYDLNAANSELVRAGKDIQSLILSWLALPDIARLAPITRHFQPAIGQELRRRRRMMIKSSIMNGERFSLGYNFTCGINAHDKLSCWGGNEYQQLNIPKALKNEKVTQVASNRARSCAVRKSDKTLHCWGEDGDDEAITIPSNLKEVRVKRVFLGRSHACVIQELDETFYCWGSNRSGQTVVPEGLGPVADASLGYNSNYTCAIKKDNGEAHCWGNNFSGQTEVPVGLKGVTQLATGGSRVCVLANQEVIREITNKESNLMCWNRSGSAQRDIPEGLGAVTQIALGDFAACALSNKATGQTLSCWSDSSTNAYGLATPPANLGEVDRVSVGYHHACAARSDGTLQCWGEGTDGPLVTPEGFRLNL